MTQTIAEYFVTNPNEYAPKVDKQELGQYDNFQMNDIYCNDTVYKSISIDGEIVDAPTPTLFQNFLAVQKVSLYGVIECNFEAIATIYP